MRRDGNRPGTNAQDSAWGRWPVPVLCVLLLIYGCSGGKTISKEEARSEMVIAVSLASEARVFLDSTRAGQLTRRFAEGHARDLATEADDSMRALEGDPDLDVAKEVQECRADVALLRREILHIPETAGSDAEFTAAGNRIAQIRTRLIAAQSTL